MRIIKASIPLLACLFIVLSIALLLTLNKDRIGYWIMGGETIYSSQYNEHVFNSIPAGMPAHEVIKRLGLPLSSSKYSQKDLSIYRDPHPAQRSGGNTTMQMLGRQTIVYFDGDGRSVRVEGDDAQGLSLGLSKQEITQKLGPPALTQNEEHGSVMEYTLPGTPGTYHVRRIYVNDDGLVVRKSSYIYFD